MRFHDRLLPRVIARLGWPSLDARLAEGVPPERDPFLAARARLLVRPAYRHNLADVWRALVAVAEGEADAEADAKSGARDHRRSHTHHVALAHARILAAEADIEQLSDALEASAPVPVRGVAMADRLLRDGTGPVYNQRSALDLRSALTDATRYLDPSEPLSGALA